MDVENSLVDDDQLEVALDQLENLMLAQCDQDYVSPPGEYDEVGVRALIDIAISLRVLAGRGRPGAR